MDKANISIEDDKLFSTEYQDIYYQNDFPIEESTYTYLWKSNLIQTISQKIFSNVQESAPSFNGVLKSLEIGFGSGLNMQVTLAGITAFRKLQEHLTKLDSEHIYAQALDITLTSERVKSQVERIFRSPKFEVFYQHNTRFSQFLKTNFNYTNSLKRLNNYFKLDIKSLSKSLFTDKYINSFVEELAPWYGDFFINRIIEDINVLVKSEVFKSNLADLISAVKQKFIYQYVSIEKYPIDVNSLEILHKKFFIRDLSEDCLTFYFLSLYSLLKEALTRNVSFPTIEKDDPALNSYLNSQEFNDKFHTTQTIKDIKQLRQKILSNIQSLDSFYLNLCQSAFVIELTCSILEELIQDLEEVKAEILCKLNKVADRLIDKSDISESSSFVITSGQDLVNIYYDSVEKVFAEYALSLGQSSFDLILLDGFDPAKNRDLWNSNLYAGLGFFAKDQAHLTTFTASNLVKRGLTAVGFQTYKASGFNKGTIIQAKFSRKEMLLDFLNDFYTAWDFPKRKALDSLAYDFSLEQANSFLAEKFPYYNGKFKNSFIGRVNQSLVNKLYQIKTNTYLPAKVFPYRKVSDEKINSLVNGRGKCEVLGSGISGISTINYLKDLQIDFILTDSFSKNKGSINPIGLVYPQLVDDSSELNNLHIRAFLYNKAVFAELGDVAKPSEILLKKKSKVIPNYDWQFVDNLSNKFYKIQGYKFYVNRFIHQYQQLNKLILQYDLHMQDKANYQAVKENILVRYFCTGAGIKEELQLDQIGFSSGKVSYIILEDLRKVLEKFFTEVDLKQSVIANLTKIESYCGKGYYTFGEVILENEISPRMPNNDIRSKKEVVLFGATHHNGKLATEIGDKISDNLVNIQNFVSDLTEVFNLNLEDSAKKQLESELLNKINSYQEDTIFGTRVNIRDRYPILGQKYDLVQYNQVLSSFKHHKYTSEFKHEEVKFDIIPDNFYLGGLGSRGLNLAPLLAINLINASLGLSLSLPDHIVEKSNAYRIHLPNLLKGNK
ncbi:MnmC family methyltransferase [Psittacicella hinzii]|uniref:MnmC family methyltransferase n=1 Tax=Psittacicella hinzii TaxID=2028575 RepID=UPI001CA72D08|nr:MnmC family methyltransferase [Psittacicella hinzii]